MFHAREGRYASARARCGGRTAKSNPSCHSRRSSSVGCIRLSRRAAFPGSAAGRDGHRPRDRRDKRECPACRRRKRAARRRAASARVPFLLRAGSRHRKRARRRPVCCGRRCRWRRWSMGRRRRRHTPRMRRAAQEREIRGHGEFGVHHACPAIRGFIGASQKPAARLRAEKPCAWALNACRRRTSCRKTGRNGEIVRTRPISRHANTPCTYHWARSSRARKARAVKPESAPCLVLDAEIVARRLGGADARHHSMAIRSGPSARATSMRTRRQRKRKGGPSGISRDGLDGLRAIEQAQRPAWCLARIANRFPGRFGIMRLLRRRSHGGGFGDMRVLAAGRREYGPHQNAPQDGRPGRRSRRRRSGLRFEGNRFADGIAFGMRHGQADQIEAEAGIERIGERRELFAKQPFDNLGIARGPARLDTETEDGAIGAEESRFERARPLAAFLENMRRSTPRAFAAWPRPHPDW